MSALADTPFTFVDGTTPEEPQWHSGQPDDPDDPSCAFASEEDAWRWHDTHCDATHPYVCEWTPEPG